jgi:hypothetical protein
MVAELINKISLLEVALKKRENKSFSFFNKLLNEINEGLVDEAVDTILKSFSIVQYADFNYKEEILFEEIWNIAEKIKNK